MTKNEVNGKEGRNNERITKANEKKMEEKGEKADNENERREMTEE